MLQGEREEGVIEGGRGCVLQGVEDGVRYHVRHNVR